MRRRVRLLEHADAEPIAELLRANDAFLAPWSPLRGSEYATAEGQRAEVDSALACYAGGDGLPLVILDDDEDVVGRLTLSGIVRGAFDSGTLGYWLAESSTGQGFATQAVRDALALAFTDFGLHRVQAGTLLHNVASQRVLGKCGFEQFGLAPRYLKIAGRWQDHLLFQKLDE